MDNPLYGGLDQGKLNIGILLELAPSNEHVKGDLFLLAPLEESYLEVCDSPSTVVEQLHA